MFALWEDKTIIMVTDNNQYVLDLSVIYLTKCSSLSSPSVLLITETLCPPPPPPPPPSLAFIFHSSSRGGLRLALRHRARPD